MAAVIEEENFDSGWGNWTLVDVLGAQGWTRDNNYGINNTPCARISGYSGGAQDNDDWLISPAMNFNNYTGETLAFSNLVNFSGPALELLVSTDYDGGGNPSGATWSNISSRAHWAPGGDYIWDTSGVVDISDFNGSAVYVAFRYLSSTSAGAAIWEVDEVGIHGTIVGGEPTNVIYMVSPTSALTAPDVAIEFTTRSISNGAAGVGYGKSKDGSGWTWNAATVSGSDPWEGTVSFSIPAPGTYYYAARWDIGGITYYGWNAEGQTNKTSLSAEYQWVVTNPTPPSARLIISKIVDGTLQGGTPKAVELANTGTTTLNLEDYTFALFSNGSMTPSYTDSLTGAIPAYSVVTLCSSFLDGHSNYFQIWGDFPDYLTDVCRGNGNDWYALLDAASDDILDIAGPIGVSSNIYTDSYMRRKENIILANPVFDAEEWTIPGVDTLDGMNATMISNEIPDMGQFTQVPEPMLFGLLPFAFLLLFRKR
jgi:hypothetical protein